MSDLTQAVIKEESSSMDTTSRNDSTQILIPTPTPNSQLTQAEMVVSVPNTAAIYFLFVEDEAAEDKATVPNKLVLARPSPTVSDLCSTLKALFFPLQDVYLTATFAGSEFPYPETSSAAVPVNDRNNVVAVSVKHRYSDSVLKMLNPQTLQTLQWLQQNNLDTPEILNLFQQHRLTLDNMKFLSDTDLLALGIQDWGTRIAIIDAINIHYAHMLPNLMLNVQNDVMRYRALDQQLALQYSDQKRSSVLGTLMTMNPSSASGANIPSMQNFQHFVNTASMLGSVGSNNGSSGSNSGFGSSSSSVNPLSLSGPGTPGGPPVNAGPGSKKRMIRFKDLDFLTQEEFIPIDIGTTAQCLGSSVRGTVVLNKQRKPVIEFAPKGGKKRTGTIAQFYKGTTNQPLQAKGDSWSKIFFFDPTYQGPLIQATQAPPGTPLKCFSLEDIKFLVKGPRKAVSAFLYFSKEIRSSLPKGDTEFAKKSGDMWKNLSNEQKGKYKKLEEEDKKRFQEDKAKYSQITAQLQRDRGLEHMEVPWKGTEEGDDGEDDDEVDDFEEPDV